MFVAFAPDPGSPTEDIRTRAAALGVDLDEAIAAGQSSGVLQLSGSDAIAPSLHYAIVADGRDIGYVNVWRDDVTFPKTRYVVSSVGACG